MRAQELTKKRKKIIAELTAKIKQAENEKETELYLDCLQVLGTAKN